MNLAQQLQSIGQWSAPAKPRSTKSGEANKRAVLAAIKDAGKMLTPREIADATQLTREHCRMICERLTQAESPLIERHGFRYGLKGMQ